MQIWVNIGHLVSFQQVFRQDVIHFLPIDRDGNQEVVALLLELLLQVIHVHLQVSIANILGTVYGRG